MGDHSTGTDTELLRASRDDTEPFRTLFIRHGEFIYTFLRSRTDTEEAAQDATAETFARAWQHRNRFRAPVDNSARPWLTGIAKRILHETRRSDGQQISLQVNLIAEADAGRPSVAAGSQFDDSMLRSLNDSERQAVTLRVIQDLPYRDVALELGCSQATARMRIMRGLRRLKTQSTRQELQQ